MLPQTDISGCFFHLSSNLRKHIQHPGLQERYMNDSQFGLQLRMIAALALVPPQDVVNSFDELCLVIPNQMMEMLTKCSTIWRILTLVVFAGIPSNALPHFLSSYRTCSMEQPKSFHEQIIISRLGVIVSKQMFHPLIQRSGSF